MNYEGQLSAQHHHQSRAPREARVNIAATHAQARRTTTTTMQKVQAHDDDTLGSGSSAVELDNETDTFGREIMQRERDARRLQNATRGDAPVLKPRARPRISELVARREREDAAVSEQRHIRTMSSGSNDSNPPLNVPREWGTRARSHRGWMRKIREPSMIDINDAGHATDKGLLAPEEEEEEKPRRTSYGSDNIWNREDERAIASENTPPSMKRARANAPTATVRESNATLRHILDSEDHEFGELSLLTSTPATTKPVRNGLARDNSERAGYYDTTSHRLEFLSERSPNRRSTLARRREDALDLDDQRTMPRRANVPRPTTSSYAEARLARRTGLVSNKENFPADDARDAPPKPSETLTISERTARAVTFKQHQRPPHARNSSLGLLQRLATSLSPNSGKSSSDAVISSGNEPMSREENNAICRRTTETTHAEPAQPVVRRAHRKSSGSQGEEVKPRVRLSNKVPAKSDQGEDSKSNETPIPREMPLDQKTPVVTGAWVDTPGPSKDSRPALSGSHTVPDVKSNTFSENTVSHNTGKKDLTSKDAGRAPYGDPNRPKSVLEEILRDARRDSTGTFGDATIQSLENIIHPNTDPTDTTLASDGAYQDANEDLDIGRPLTQAEKDRRQEDLAIEAMNKHLRAARTSIKDADRGLQRVENKWETTSHTEVPQSATTISKPIQATTLDRDWRTVCDHCGGSYNSLWYGLWTELRSVFCIYDKNARFGLRITWPGILVLSWLLWYTLENILCYNYCHPLYAEYMVGFGVDMDAPVYPFVIPTLLFRPLRPIWKPALKWAGKTSMEVFYTVFGAPEKPIRRFRPVMESWDVKMPIRQHAGGAWSSTWAGRAATTAVAAAGRATRSFVDAVDAMGGETMGDDEYL
ncbi:hypothetical protein Q7P35_009160 [Cladosporium inversicolor]